jgi:hypothetical protein
MSVFTPKSDIKMLTLWSMLARRLPPIIAIIGSYSSRAMPTSRCLEAQSERMLAEGVFMQTKFSTRCTE